MHRFKNQHKQKRNCDFAVSPDYRTNPDITKSDGGK